MTQYELDKEMFMLKDSEKEIKEEEKMETNTNDERLTALEKEIAEFKDELARIRKEAESYNSAIKYISSDAEALYNAYRMAYRTGFCDAMDYAKEYNYAAIEAEIKKTLYGELILENESTHAGNEYYYTPAAKVDKKKEEE